MIIDSRTENIRKEMLLTIKNNGGTQVMRDDMSYLLIRIDKLEKLLNLLIEDIEVQINNVKEELVK